jgi:hypothetical protein
MNTKFPLSAYISQELMRLGVALEQEQPNTNIPALIHFTRKNILSPREICPGPAGALITTLCAEVYVLYKSALKLPEEQTSTKHIHLSAINNSEVRNQLSIMLQNSLDAGIAMITPLLKKQTAYVEFPEEIRQCLGDIILFRLLLSLDTVDVTMLQQILYILRLENPGEESILNDACLQAEFIAHVKRKPV